MPCPEHRGPTMRRREFITLVGGAAAWPLVARAQRPAKSVIGFLSMASRSTFASRIEGFRLGLRDFGYIEGTNITVEYRFAEGHYERLPELAAGLVRSKVDLIVTHGTPGSLAAKRATTTIPIVMTSIGDPVATGIVASIARPGGNITGQTFFNPELRAKRIELLKELMPHLTHVAVILNADNPAAVGPEFQAMEKAAQALNIKLQPFRLREPSELVSAFEKMEQAQAEAVETGDDPLSVGNVGAIVALAARGRLLSIGPEDVPRAGGVIGYGADIVALFRSAAIFVDRILKGANPADLPIERVSKFQFILNRKAAKALGFEVPQSILLRADEVIE
jgi:putative tryptophan/tyrosine transport system substrate-binding protein